MKLKRTVAAFALAAGLGLPFAAGYVHNRNLDIKIETIEDAKNYKRSQFAFYKTFTKIRMLREPSAAEICAAEDVVACVADRAKSDLMSDQVGLVFAGAMAVLFATFPFGLMGSPGKRRRNEPSTPAAA